MEKNSLLLLFILLFGYNLFSQSDLIIQNVNIVDVESGKIIEKQDLIIRQGKIEKIGKSGSQNLPASVTRLDGTNQWLIPGLLDGHIHFFQSGGLYTRPDAVDLTKYRPYEKERQWLLDHVDEFLLRYTAAGITTVCDVGGPMSNYDVKKHAQNQAFAPQVFITGPLISSYQPAAFNIEDPPIIKINSPDEARELVRKQLPYKPDFIKIWYIVFPNEKAEVHLEMVKATIEESHQHGIPVAVHATQLKTAKLAVEAGADILVHSVEDAKVNEEFILLLKKNNVSYIPTLIVGDNYTKTFSQQNSFSDADFAYAHPQALGSLMDLAHIPSADIPPYIRRMKDIPFTRPGDWSVKLENLKTLMDAGVNVVTGTDAGNIGTLHASSYFDELAAMQEAGLSEADILRASTLNGAKMLGTQKTNGTIEMGRTADLVLLPGNPLENLKWLQSPSAVVRNGKVFYPDTLLKPSPEQIVQQQLNAYNAGNLEAFLACYHDDIRIYNYPDELSMEGKEAMRNGYGGMFKQLPDLHAKLVNRMVLGNTVIDQEYVTGFPNDRVIQAIAVYKVKDGIITEVRFIRP